jgi:hypothetical protein
MFESAEDQELLAIADNGIPQQAGFVDFQGAFQGMWNQYGGDHIVAK